MTVRGARPSSVPRLRQVAAAAAASATSSSDAPMLAWTRQERALDERGLAHPDPGPFVGVEHLEGDLEAERGAPEVEQDQGPVPAPSRTERIAASIRGAVVPTGRRRFRRPSRPGPRSRRTGRRSPATLDERRAVGDEDETDQSRLLSVLRVRSPMPDRPPDLSRRKQEPIWIRDGCGRRPFGPSGDCRALRRAAYTRPVGPAEGAACPSVTVSVRRATSVDAPAASALDRGVESTPPPSGPPSAARAGRRPPCRVR